MDDKQGQLIKDAINTLKREAQKLTHRGVSRLDLGDRILVRDKVRFLLRELYYLNNVIESGCSVPVDALQAPLGINLMSALREFLIETCSDERVDFNRAQELADEFCRRAKDRDWIEYHPHQEHHIVWRRQ